METDNNMDHRFCVRREIYNLGGGASGVKRLGNR